MKRLYKASVDHSANIFLIVSSLALIAVAISLFLYFENKNQKLVFDNAQSNLSQVLKTSADSLKDRYNRNVADVRFLANTPPIRGIMRAKANQDYDNEENTPLDLWRERLSQIFYAYLSSQPDIAQIRYISSADEGMELVRVERRHGDGAIRIVSDSDLQSKAQRQYYQSTQQLAKGEVFISDINLNREHGRLDYPHWPTYRVATPVYDAQSDFFGIIIINYNARFMLQELQSDLPDNISMFLLNTAGQYLLNPVEPAAAFQFELDTGASSWQQDYLNAEWDGQKILTRQKTDTSFLYQQTTFPLTGSQSDEQHRALSLIATAPLSLIEAKLSERRNSSIILLTAIILIGGTIMFIYRMIVVKQAALGFTQSQYAALVEGSRDAILTLTTGGVIQDYNRASLTVLGGITSELRDKRLEDIFEKANKDLLHSTLSQCLADKPLEAIDVEQPTPSGQLQVFSITFSPIRDKSGTIIGASTLIRDVTREYNFKHELAQLNQSLEDKVQTRTQELLAARNQAIEASVMKSSFVANVSHEIRTPLNGVIGMHNLLRREQLTPKQQGYLEAAMKSAKTLMMLINDLLDLSKIEAGQLDIESLPLNLIDNFSQVANSMATRALDKNVEIVLDIAGISHSDVKGDALRLRQILNNLISNAIKFTERGEIIISASTHLDPETGNIILESSVKDSGIGIEPAKVSRLFKAFSQADASTTRRFGGTGLGLSIVQNLCQLMGGHCQVSSEAGVGSTFSFTLQLQPDGNKTSLESFIDLSGMSVHIDENHQALHDSLQKLITLWRGTLIHDVEQADVVIARLNERSQNTLQQAHRQDAYSHGFVYSLQLKQRHLLDEITLSKQTQVIFRPILPVELATALSTLTGKPLSPVLSEHVSTLDTTSYAEELKSLKQNSILIVDDNEINRKVAAGILEKYGFELLTAADGEQALQMLIDKPQIRLILMDCQMPVMDGFKATEMIRSGRAGQSKSRIPIIAMTAGAMTGDREACISAGMDDYLTKPLSADELEKKVGIWLSAVENRHGNHTASSPAQTRKTQTFPSKTAFWDKQASLSRLMSDESLFMQMLEMFEQQTPPLISEIESHISEQDFDMVRRHAHKLKGSASAIGAVAVLDVARQLETDAENEDISASNHSFNKLKTNIEQMLLAIRDYKNTV